MNEFIAGHMPMIYIEVGDDVLRSYRATTAPRVGETIWLSRPAGLRLHVAEVIHRFGDDPGSPGPDTVHVVCEQEFDEHGITNNTFALESATTVQSSVHSEP